MTHTTAREGMIGTRDEHFNLISVLYHTLQEAETVDRYIEDADRAGDSELAEFFRELQRADRERAERAKQLARSRLPEARR